MEDDILSGECFRHLALLLVYTCSLPGRQEPLEITVGLNTRVFCEAVNLEKDIKLYSTILPTVLSQ